MSRRDRRLPSCAGALVLAACAGLVPVKARAQGATVNGVYRADVMRVPTANTGTLMGCVYRANSLAAELTAASLGAIMDGQLVPLACDATGALITVTPGSGSAASALGTNANPDVVAPQTNSTWPLPKGAATQADQANRTTWTQTQVSVPAGTSTLVLAANPTRRTLRISGTNAGDSFHLGYGVAASATSSALFGSGGVFGAEQFGAGDGVPTGAIYAYGVAAFTAQVGEGN